MYKLLIPFFLFFLSIINSNAQWEACNNGIADYQINCFIVDGNNTYAGTNGGVIKTTNNGVKWTYKNTGFIGSYGLNVINVLTLAIQGNIYYAGTNNGIFQSSDNGENWIRKSNGLFHKMNGIDSIFIPISTLTVNDNYIFAGTPYGVYVSTYKGENWIPKNNGLYQSDTVNTSVIAFAIKDKKIFAGTEFGVFLSTDNGDNWTKKNKGLTSSDTSVASIAIIGNQIFAGTRRGIYLSTNDGDNWHFSGLKDTLVVSFLALGNNVFTAALGVYLTTDNGNNWTPHNSGLTDLDITTLNINGNYIFAGTYLHGVFRAKLSDFGITDVKETEQKNENIIYSNLANDFLDFTFAPELSQFKIEIFSIEGIKMCETEPMKRIDVSRLVPGLYFVKLGSRVEKFVKM